MPIPDRWPRAGLLAVAAVTAVRLGVAARWGLLADEAYHWTWSLRPALGYYDQPPLVAWVLWLGAHLGGHHAIALRAPAVLGWGAAALVLARWVRSRETWLWWALGLPPLALLTVLAVPDGLLLPLWALGLGAAIRGGRGWWAAGVLGGLASLTKYTGIGLLPLLILGADPAERRTRDPWIGLALAVALLAPNLLWNAAHGWVSFAFQLHEGLLSPHPPGLGGIVRQVLDQALFAGPIAAAAGAVWMARGAIGWRGLDRVDRLCLATSAPLAVGFALAALGGPPEAYWPAPAWIGVGLGLARSGGRLLRVASLAVALSALQTAAIAVHAERPLLPLVADPGTRLTEGRLMADLVAQWVVPASAEGGREALPVYTERYQEAALLRWHTGLDAHTLPGCGRRSQDDLDRADGRLPAAPAAEAWFLRPARSGPPACAEAWYGRLRGPHPIWPIDAQGRRVGPWDLFEASERREAP
ncbi:MAG: glycosyltransferase family 39 protein [Myxococcota bacterium]